MWNHFHKPLMTPNFMANGLNNDAFETKSHSFPVKEQLKMSFSYLPSDLRVPCVCCDLVFPGFCSLFEALGETTTC